MGNIQSETSSGDADEAFPRKRRLSLPILPSPREFPNRPASPSVSSEPGARGRKKTCREFTRDLDLATFSLNLEPPPAETKEPTRTRSEGRRRRRAARRKRRKEAKIERKKAAAAEAALNIVAEGSENQSKNAAKSEEAMDEGIRTTTETDTNGNCAAINPEHTDTASKGSISARNARIMFPESTTGFGCADRQHPSSGIEKQQRGRSPKGRQDHFTNEAKPWPTPETTVTRLHLKSQGQPSSLPSNPSLDQPESQTPLNRNQQNAKSMNPPDTEAASPDQQQNGSPCKTPLSGEKKLPSTGFLTTEVRDSPSPIQGNSRVCPTRHGQPVGLPPTQQLQPQQLVALASRSELHASGERRQTADDERPVIPNDTITQQPVTITQHYSQRTPPTQAKTLSESSPRSHHGADKYSPEVHLKEDRPFSPYSLPESISYTTATTEVSTDHSQAQHYKSSLVYKSWIEEQSLSQTTSITSEQETIHTNSGSTLVASPRLRQPAGTAINDFIGVPGQPKHYKEEYISHQSSFSDTSNCSSRVSAARAFWRRRTHKVSPSNQKLIAKEKQQQQQSEDYPQEGNNWSDVYTHFFNGWDGSLSDDNVTVMSDPKTVRTQAGDEGDSGFGSPEGTLSDVSMPVLRVSSTDLLDAESVYIKLAHFEGGKPCTPQRSFECDGWELTSPYHHFALEAESDEEFWNRLDFDIREYEGTNTLELVQFASQKIRRYRAVLVIQRWWWKQLARKAKNRNRRITTRKTTKRLVRTERDGGWWHRSGFRRRLFGPPPSPSHSTSSSSQSTRANNTCLSQETASVVIQHWIRSLDKRDERTSVNYGWVRSFDQTPADEGSNLHRFIHASGSRNKELDVLRIQRWWRKKAKLSGHAGTAVSEPWFYKPEQRENVSSSAVIVQRWWRKQECSARDKRKAQAKLAAVVGIQRWWSSILGRRKLAKSGESQILKEEDKNLCCEEIGAGRGLQNSQMAANLHFVQNFLHYLNAAIRIQRWWRHKVHRALKQKSVFVKKLATPFELSEVPGQSRVQDTNPGPAPPDSMAGPAALVCVAPAQDLRPFSIQKGKMVLNDAKINRSIDASDGSQSEESVSPWIGDIDVSYTEDSLGHTKSSPGPDYEKAFKLLGFQEESKEEQTFPTAGKSASEGIDRMQDDAKILTGAEINKASDANDGSQSEEFVLSWIGDINVSSSEASFDCTESSAAKKVEPPRTKPSVYMLVDGYFQSASNGFLALKIRPSGKILTLSGARRPRKKNMLLSQNQRLESNARRGLVAKLSRFLQSNPALTSIILAGKSTELIPKRASGRRKKKVNRERPNPLLKPRETEKDKHIASNPATPTASQTSTQESPDTAIQPATQSHLTPSFAAFVIQLWWRFVLAQKEEKQQLLEPKSSFSREIALDTSAHSAAQTMQRWKGFLSKKCADAGMVNTTEDSDTRFEDGKQQRLRVCASVLAQQANAILEMNQKLVLAQVRLDKFAAAAVIQRWWAAIAAKDQNNGSDGIRGASAQAEQFRETPQPTSAQITGANKTSFQTTQSAGKEDLSAAPPNRVVAAEQSVGCIFQHSQPSLALASEELEASLAVQRWWKQVIASRRHQLQVAQETVDLARQTGDASPSARRGACALIQKRWRGLARGRKEGEKSEPNEESALASDALAPNDPRPGETNAEPLRDQRWQAVLGMLEHHETALAHMNDQLLGVERSMENYTASTLNHGWGSNHPAQQDMASGGGFDDLNIRRSDLVRTAETTSSLVARNLETNNQAQKEEEVPSAVCSPPSVIGTALQQQFEHDIADNHKSSSSELEVQQTLFNSFVARSFSPDGEGISSQTRLENQQPVLSSSEAALVIQNWWKCCLTSQQALPLKQEPAIASIAPHEAALVMQQWWKCVMARHPQHKEMPLSPQPAGLTENAAATCIQRWWREADTSQSRTTIGLPASSSWKAQQQPLVPPQLDLSANNEGFAGGITGTEENMEPSTQGGPAEMSQDAQQRPFELTQLGLSSDDNNFTSGIQNIQGSLELSIQESLEAVKSSWVLLSSNPRSFASGQKDMFMSLVNRLSQQQDQSIELWKASASHHETMILEASATKVQSCWRMHMTRTNYVRLVAATEYLPGITRTVMMSRISGPKLWGSSVRHYLNCYTPNLNC